MASLDFELQCLLRLLTSLVCGALVGLERERGHRPAGLRTHTLVCVGSCLVMITSFWAMERYGLAIDPTRMGAQVISGIGFLGAGTIIKAGRDVRGLTTAACLWMVACVGLAAGAGYYLGSLGATALVLVTLHLFKWLESRLARNRPRGCACAVHAPRLIQKEGTALRAVIVGAGASGLLAAHTLACLGAQVTLAERYDRMGRKLLATGNGRCNLTNLRALPDAYHGTGKALALNALATIPPQALIDHFETLGLRCREEGDGRVYPASGQAAAVLDVLRLACQRAGVDVRCGQAVTGLTHGDAGFTAALAGGETFHADRVLVTTGGKAAPKLGSDGSGYALLTAFGHTLCPCAPALTPLRCNAPSLRPLKGLRVRAEATLLAEDRALAAQRGEVLFTDYGLSGIAVMGLARHVTPALAKGQKVWVRLNLSALTLNRSPGEEVSARCALFGSQPAADLFTGLLPRRVGEALISAARIPLDTPCAHVPPDRQQGLAALLTDWRLPVTGTLGFDQAQVTAGGIDGRQFEPATLASLLQPGLYAAGEVLDVDGDCGGLNLHFAFASALLAARAMGGKGTL
ncbi:MAG: aminoacetone oxidase family FAD-binding enzyme [Oscillospiraceae bacterium]|jgi:predicted Rossmann fold flavoprotein|nr:aminoacetone oxidase family FAD-binding enzyme [Oscillospiraceae bacterium]